MINQAHSLVENPKRLSVPFPSIITNLFVLFSAYLAIPIIDLPLLGLSVSAPILFVIALHVFIKPPEPWVRRYFRWLFISSAIWYGIFLSATFNGLFVSVGRVTTDTVISLVRYAYWLIVLVTTTYLVSRSNLGFKISKTLGWAIFITALLRLFEAVVWNKVGAWTDTVFLTQNSYGFLFSVFSPFVVFPLIDSKKSSLLLDLVKAFSVWIAVFINGSRGAWVGTLIGIAVVLFFFVLTKPSKGRGLIILLFVCLMGWLLFNFAPYQIISTFNDRFATFQKLEDDKSYMIRQLMVQKGLRLFSESPLIGIGTSRFRKASTELDIPNTLSYASQSHFDRKSSHNSYVGFLAENGLVGAIPLGVLLLTLLLYGGWATYALARRNSWWAVAFFAAFISMSVHMWVIASLTNTLNWFIYGLVASLTMLPRNEV